MMKVDPVRLGALAAQAAEERRSAREREHRPGAGMVGSGHPEEAATADEKERA
jgi:hypothetical protein